MVAPADVASEVALLQPLVVSTSRSQVSRVGPEVGAVCLASVAAAVPCVVEKADVAVRDEVT